MTKRACLLMMLAVGLLGWLAVGHTLPSIQAILVRALQDGEPGGLELSIDKGTGAVYAHGDELNITVRSDFDGYLWLVNLPADNGAKPHVIFPNQYHQDNFVQGGVEHTVPGTLFPFVFEVIPPDGKDVILAVVLEEDRGLVEMDFTSILTELQGTPEEEAELLTQAIRIIGNEPDPPRIATAMTYYYVGRVPESDGWALFIGFNRYHRDAHVSATALVEGRRVQFADLNYGAADAHAMADALSADFTHQRVLVDGQATMAAIESAITNWLAEAPEDATVLIYYAGHGVRERDEDGNWRPALVSYDVQLMHDRLMAGWLEQISARTVVFIADTSFAGTTTFGGVRTFWRRGEWAVDFPPLTEGFCELLFGHMEGWTGQLAAMCGAGPAQVAQESMTFGHGVYTEFLIRGLRGAADLDGDGVITAQELHDFVTHSMEGLYPEQVPRLFGLPDALVALVQAN